MLLKIVYFTGEKKSTILFHFENAPSRIRGEIWHLVYNYAIINDILIIFFPIFSPPHTHHVWYETTCNWEIWIGQPLILILYSDIYHKTIKTKIIKVNFTEIIEIKHKIIQCFTSNIFEVVISSNFSFVLF